MREISGGRHVDVGDKVEWLYTEGGGGGSGKRPNRKRPLFAEVIALGPKNIRIAVLNYFYAGASRYTWVRPENLR